MEADPHAAPPRLRAVLRVAVACPIARETLTAIVAGDLAAVERDTGSAAVLAHLRASDEFGDFGLYSGVCEIGLGVEAFTPRAGSNATLGTAGERTLSPTVSITTYLPAATSEERLGALLARLAAAHPWEVPVIEVMPARLLTLR